MKKKRPIHLNLTTIRFPITAWISIAHRLSGVLVFLLIPALLWMLQGSLASKEQFLALKMCLHSSVVALGMWILLAAIAYHFVAGIRHLCLDLHIGESKTGGRIGAWLVMGIFLIFLALIGYWIW